MGNNEFVTDPCRFYELLLDDRLINLNILFLTEEMVQVSYKFKDQYVENSTNTNIFVAVYTTANARLRLYSMLEKLDRAVYYCDTDSVVYLDNGSNTVKTGDLLGEWTDEVGEGNHITQWTCAGLKSYYYKTLKGKECTKAKGFTLNHKNSEKINGQSMEQIIDREVDKIRVTDMQIARDPNTKNLITKDLTKTFAFTFDKRVLCGNYSTLPYGFVE